MAVAEGIGKTTENLYTKNGRALVSKVSTDAGDLKGSILRSVDLIGGFKSAFNENDEILLKPNFNTSDAPPGSSDPGFVKAIIELLYAHGVSKVVLGESSMFSLCTRKILEDTGMAKKAKEAGALIAYFDEDRWIKVGTGGKYLKRVSLPGSALAAKKVVYACCMKTHKWAKFTVSLKLAVGFVKPVERMRMHARRLEEKIADLNMVVHPSLVIVDGRKCFINGGPACGETRNLNIIMASGDRVAIDAEAVKAIKNFKGTSLTDDPWNYTQIRNASRLGLGAKNEGEYDLVQ